MRPSTLTAYRALRRYLGLGHQPRHVLEAQLRDAAVMLDLAERLDAEGLGWVARGLALMAADGKGPEAVGPIRRATQLAGSRR